MDQSDFTVGIGTPGGEQSTYSIEIRGELAESDGSLEGNDAIKGGWRATGEVWGGWDEYVVRGWITTIEAPDQVKVEVDGNRMSHDEALGYRPDRFVDDGGGGGDDDDAGDGPPTDRGGDSEKRAPWKARVGDYSDPGNGVLGRKERSAGDRTLYVGHGNFGTGLGTENDPLGTVQDALNCDPKSVEHGCVIALSKGVHDNEPGRALNSGQIEVHQTADWRLRGDRKNPGNHVIDVEQANFQVSPGTAQNARIEGVTVDGTVQIYNGSFGIRDSVIRGGERWGRSDGVALDAYRGHYQIEDTKLVSKSEAINAVEHLDVSFGSGVEIDVDGPLFGTGMGGGTVSMGSDTEVSCNGYLTDPNWDAALMEVHDPHEVLEGLDPGGFADVRR